MATNPNVEEKKAVEDILHSKGVSSVAQKDKTPFQKFLSSSIAFVIALEVLLILIFGLTAQPGTFLTVSNMMNILMNSAQMIILAVGLTYVISSGYFDLSVGMNLILCSVVAAKVFKLVAGTPAEISQGLYPHMVLGVIAAIITAIVIGMAGGALNAFATSKLKLTSPINPEKGCRFAKRCPYATDACRQQDMVLTEEEPGHFVTCLRVQRGEI